MENSEKFFLDYASFENYGKFPTGKKVILFDQLHRSCDNSIKFNACLYPNRNASKNYTQKNLAIAACLPFQMKYPEAMEFLYAFCAPPTSSSEARFIKRVRNIASKCCCVCFSDITEFNLKFDGDMSEWDSVKWLELLDDASALGVLNPPSSTLLANLFTRN